MDFPFVVTGLLHCDADGFAIIDGQDSAKYRKNATTSKFNAQRTSSHFANTVGVTSNSSVTEQLDDIIDKMGAASAKA
jgi:hypothetical protein